jgi:hypothetical protein
MQIQVVLHKDRTQPGRFQALADAAPTVLFGPVACLGKADNNDAALHGNPTRDSKRQFGDTPTGTYHVTAMVPHSGESDLHTYGAFPSLLLDPQSGDALLAKVAGREGLMIHGGAPSATGGLRPTHGCIRLTEDSQNKLIALIATASLSSLTVSVSES